MRCLPREVEFPDGFNVCYTENHWSNEEKVIELFQEVIFPFIASKKSGARFGSRSKGTSDL